MRKIVTFFLVSLLFTAVLPAHASLADRMSDEVSEVPARPAYFSGQTVVRGMVKYGKPEKIRNVSAPYSGRVVIRGEVKAEGHI